MGFGRCLFLNTAIAGDNGDFYFIFQEILYYSFKKKTKKKYCVIICQDIKFMKKNEAKVNKNDFPRIPTMKHSAAADQSKGIIMHKKWVKPRGLIVNRVHNNLLIYVWRFIFFCVLLSRFKILDTRQRPNKNMRKQPWNMRR